MNADPTDDRASPRARSTIRRCRIIAGSLILGSLAGVLGGPAAINHLSLAEFFGNLSSPKAILFLSMFYLIYIPASLRIYYISLLNAKGVFTAAERQYYRAAKQKWEKYLLKSALLAGTLVILVLVATLLTH